jgi:diguanylate cyclase (GGDEF)-like protein
MSAPVALMMVDIDRFKTINDTFGHAIGDEVLRHVACSIEGAVANEADRRNLPARIGGDEFAVVLIGLSVPAACGVAERICRAVQGGCQLSGAEPETTSVSIGITFRAPGQDVDEAMKEADDAAYRAKRAGRDRWVLAAPLDGFERDTPDLPRPVEPCEP